MRYTNAPRLLFMSGASSEPLHELIRHGAGFIKKPFLKKGCCELDELAIPRQFSSAA